MKHFLLFSLLSLIFSVNLSADILETVNLENGIVLDFVPVPEIEAVLVTESGECRGFSAINLLRSNYTVQEVNALHIFWAFSVPGTPVPPLLVQYYGRETSNIPYLQGWARPLALESAATVVAAACNNSKFTNHKFLAGKRTTEFVKLDYSPGDAGFNTRDCDNRVKVASGCFPPNAYKFQRTTRKIKHFRGRICAESKGSHTYGVRCDRGNGYEHCTITRLTQVAFQVRNSSGWKDLIRKEIPVGATRVYQWYVQGKTAKTFRVDIRYAGPSDIYDVIMTSH